jgi:hypothetical protein
MTSNVEKSCKPNVAHFLLTNPSGIGEEANGLMSFTLDAVACFPTHKDRSPQTPQNHWNQKTLIPRLHSSFTSRPNNVLHRERIKLRITCCTELSSLFSFPPSGRVPQLFLDVHDLDIVEDI